MKMKKTQPSVVNVLNEQKPIFINLLNYVIEPQIQIKFIFVTKIVKKSYIWATLQTVRNFVNTAMIKSSYNQTNIPSNQDEFSFNFTIEESEQKSELDKKVIKLFEKKIVDETYVVDLFKQEQIFKDNFEEIKKNQYKEVLVCGDEIFTGDNFEEILQKARTSHPNKPFYSYSFKNESMIL
jgi:hypothetical protein